MIKKYYVGIIAFLFVLIVLNSLCFGQASQTGTNRVMIKGKWVDVPVFTIRGQTYDDAHPEGARAQKIYDMLRPPGENSYEGGVRRMKIMNMMDELKDTGPPPSVEAEQGYGRGMYRHDPIPFSPSPPSINRGAINVRTGEFYPPVGGGVINPKTGTLYIDAAGGRGYINTKTGEFVPKIGGR